MKPLDLAADPLAAAVRTRPAEPRLIVWVHRSARGTWCVLRRATGGRNIFLCCDWSPGNEPVHILTSAAEGDGERRMRYACPACMTELAAGTPAAAVAGEPFAVVELGDVEPDDAAAIAEPRVVTRDLRPAGRRSDPVDPVAAWDEWYATSNHDAPRLPDEDPLGRDAEDDSPFDHLNDLRPEEP